MLSCIGCRTQTPQETLLFTFVPTSPYPRHLLLTHFDFTGYNISFIRTKTLSNVFVIWFFHQDFLWNMYTTLTCLCPVLQACSPSLLNLQHRNELGLRKGYVYENGAVYYA